MTLPRTLGNSFNRRTVRRLGAFIVPVLVALTVALSASAVELRPGGYFMLTREGSGGTLGTSDGASAGRLPRLHQLGRADGTRWTTDGSTRFVIALSNGIVLSQDVDSKIVFERFSQAPFDDETAATAPVLEPSRSQLSLRLELGMIALRTGELRANSNVRIALGDAVLHVGGGLFWIQNTGSEIEVRMHSGRARLESPGREAVFLAVGDRLRTEGGEPVRESLQNMQIEEREETLLRSAERGFRRIRIHAPSADDSPPLIRLIYPPRTPRQ